MAQRNSPERTEALFHRMQGRRARLAGFTPFPARKSRSTRGLRTPSWLTKAHTPSRIRDMTEAAS